MSKLIEKIEAIDSPFGDSYILKTDAITIVREHESQQQEALKEAYLEGWQDGIDVGSDYPDFKHDWSLSKTYKSISQDEGDR